MVQAEEIEVNGYLAALIVMLLFVLRFAVPLAIVVGLGFFISWVERRMRPDVPAEEPTQLSMQ